MTKKNWFAFVNANLFWLYFLDNITAMKECHAFALITQQNVASVQGVRQTSLQYRYRSKPTADIRVGAYRQPMGSHHITTNFAKQHTVKAMHQTLDRGLGPHTA